jgi:hypothetical protein
MSISKENGVPSTADRGPGSVREGAQPAVRARGEEVVNRLRLVMGLSDVDYERRLMKTNLCTGNIIGEMR